MKVIVKGKGPVLLSKNNYRGSGGEGTVYFKDGIGYKIYHDPKKMIPVGKIQELSQIKLPNVLAPIDILLDEADNPVGFTMVYIDRVEFLCKLFTKSFRDRCGVTVNSIVDLVKEMQKTLVGIHKKGFLVVDYNEMNFLVSPDFSIPYYIDVDSYKTPSFPPTAIMESVRDRKISKNQFTEGSDWFSWAVVTFQLYMGIHPYKGRHQDYKPKDWMKMMDDDMSVFHPDVRLPAVCQDWGVIPKPHYEWYKRVFLKGDRSAPPFADQVGLISVATPVFITGNGKFQVAHVQDYPDTIHNVLSIDGIRYVITDREIYAGSKTYYSSVQKVRKGLLETPGMTPTIVLFDRNDKIKFIRDNDEIAEVSADGVMSCDNIMYTALNGTLWKNNCTAFGTKVVHHTESCGKIFEPSYKMFPGVVVQDILGTCWIYVHYKPSSALNLHVQELDGHRIIDAKYQAANSIGFCIILSEKRGVYTRSTLCFDLNNFEKYSLRMDGDVDFDSINFTVLPNGLCVTIISDLRVEAFFSNDKVKTLDNPPFNSSMKLYHEGNTVLFATHNKLYSVSIK